MESMATHCDFFFYCVDILWRYLIKYSVLIVIFDGVDLTEFIEDNAEIIFNAGAAASPIPADPTRKRIDLPFKQVILEFVHYFLEEGALYLGAAILLIRQFYVH